MKTSLVIPCTPAHFSERIGRTLGCLRSGTVQPDEIIVSLSLSQSIDKGFIEDIKQEYDVTILEHSEKLTHGPNRQEGSNASSGDLIIYQDADDIPHPQRVEIIKHFFETKDIVHLNHFWIPESMDFDVYDKDAVEYTSSQTIYDFVFPNKAIEDCFDGGGYGSVAGRTTGGLTAVTRNVLDTVRWKDWGEIPNRRAEDYMFCCETLFFFNKSIIVHAELNKYTNPDAEEMYRRDK